MRFMTTSILGTHAIGQFLGRQTAIGLDHGPFPMHPLRLNRIEPGTRARHTAHTDANTTMLSGLDRPVVQPHPCPHRVADMPRGVVPDQHQDRFVQGTQVVAAPRQKVRRDGAHGSATHTPQQQLIRWGTRTVTRRCAGRSR